MKNKHLNPARNHAEKETFSAYQKRRQQMNKLTNYKLKHGVLVYKHALPIPVQVSPGKTELMQPARIPYRRGMELTNSRT